MPRLGTLGARSTGDGPPLTRMLGVGAVRSWTRRLVRGLVLLDSWTPAAHRMSSPHAARRHLRAEWTRSGALTESQAAALLALDETTPWEG